MRVGWCFEAAHIPGVVNVLADGISRWPRETINSRLSSLYPRIHWQEARLGKSGGTTCSGVLQAYYRRSEWLLRPTSLTCEAAWRLSTQWRLVVVHIKFILGHGVGRGGGSERDRDVHGAFVFSRGKEVSTVEGKLIAVQHFHRRVGVELPMKHFIVKPVKAGIARESALKGQRQRFRRLISWDLVGDEVGIGGVCLTFG